MLTYLLDIPWVWTGWFKPWRISDIQDKVLLFYFELISPPNCTPASERLNLSFLLLKDREVDVPSVSILQSIG